MHNSCMIYDNIDLLVYYYHLSFNIIQCSHIVHVDHLQSTLNDVMFKRIFVNTVSPEDGTGTLSQGQFWRRSPLNGQVLGSLSL